MKTIEIQVYSFNELSEKAQEKAINKFIEDGYFDYIFDEAYETVEKFFALFPASIRSIDFLEPYRNDIRFDNIFEQKELVDHLNSIKSLVIGDCPLTGMCYDMDILEPILEYYKDCTKYSDLETLINACVINLCKSVSKEYYSNLTKEAIAETCEANDYYFTSDGKLQS